MAMNLDAVIADFHTHSIASDHAYSTVTELAGAAAEQELLAMACTDHGIGEQDAPHVWHFWNMSVLPPYIRDVRFLHGVEANVMDRSGRIDMPENVMDMLDIVIASMHAGLMPEGDCTEAWLEVARNPHVDIIGHSGWLCYSYDLERVIPAFGRGGKAVEINENGLRTQPEHYVRYRKIAECCKRNRVPVVLDSDAHYHELVGKVPMGLKLMKEVEFPTELIINGSKPALDAFFKTRHIAW